MCSGRFSGSCALLLLFLSDGKPSDRIPSNLEHDFGDATYSSHKQLNSAKCEHVVEIRIGELASQFGRRLTVATIGFGSPREDFSVLTKMANTSKDYGCIGIFQAPSLTVESLGTAMSSLTLSLTETKTELTHLGSNSSQRTVRTALRESRNTLDDHMLTDNWFHYRYLYYGLEAVVRFVTERNSSGYWADESMDHLTGGVALRRTVFGEGAERMVSTGTERIPPCTFITRCQLSWIRTAVPCHKSQTEGVVVRKIVMQMPRVIPNLCWIWLSIHI